MSQRAQVLRPRCDYANLDNAPHRWKVNNARVISSYLRQCDTVKARNCYKRNCYKRITAVTPHASPGGREAASSHSYGAEVSHHEGIQVAVSDLSAGLNTRATK